MGAAQWSAARRQFERDLRRDRLRLWRQLRPVVASVRRERFGAWSWTWVVRVDGARLGSSPQHATAVRFATSEARRLARVRAS